MGLVAFVFARCDDGRHALDTRRETHARTHLTRTGRIGLAVRYAASTLCLACACAALGLLLQGCTGKSDPKPSVAPRTFASGAFRPYDSSRVIVDSVHIDVDGDGRPEFVITSRAVASVEDPMAAASFDRLEVFRYDTARALYTSLFVDPVESGAQLRFEDVTRRGGTDVVVTTAAGGNDAIASNGLCIYGRRQSGSFSLLFYESSGAPVIRDVNGDGIPELLIRDEYWGVMSHDEAIEYIAEIHSFNGSEYVESNLKFAGYFDREIATRRSGYQQLKAKKHPSSAEVLETYRSCLDLLLWLISKGDLYEVRKVWNNEKPFLSLRLPVDQFEDLDGLVQDALAEQQQVSLPEDLL
jgi:hypothetical protein